MTFFFSFGNGRSQVFLWTVSSLWYFVFVFGLSSLVSGKAGV